MADLYLKFKLRVKLGDGEVQTCIKYALVITNRK